ncbi:MAG TPA: nucleotidyltransferase family protein [Puia sp.]|jgi:NDP-sugar pyrophosphorylase family protein
MKAMIFAAGLGTRFKPWTEKHPKALAPINGKSLLERNIRYLQQFGITEVVLNVHHFADQIMEAIAKNEAWGSRIAISEEIGEVLETGGGLKKASWFFTDGPFVVMNADILTDLDLNNMIAFHRQHTPLATLAVTNRKSSRYFLFNEKNRLCGWRNIKTGEERLVISGPGVPPVKSGDEPAQGSLPVLNEKAFSGIHIISPDLFSFLHREGKFSIVDVYLELAGRKPILEFDHSGSKLVDVGKPEAVAVAERMFI